MPSFKIQAHIFTRRSVFDSPKGSSNTFKTHKNISLYFKRRYLIIYKYCILVLHECYGIMFQPYDKTLLISWLPSKNKELVKENNSVVPTMLSKSPRLYGFVNNKKFPHSNPCALSKALVKRVGIQVHAIQSAFSEADFRTLEMGIKV